MGPRVFNDVEYELAGSALGDSYDALVGHVGCPFLFVCAVFAFKECDIWIVGGKQVEHSIECVRVGPFVGVFAENDI